VNASTDRGRPGEQPNALSARGLDFVIALALVLCIAAVAIPLANPELDHRYVAAVVAALQIASTIWLGIYAWRSDTSRRFGALLVLGGVGMFLTTLSNADASLPYSVGRIAGWWMEVAILYALLAYPTGRLTSSWDRYAVGLGAAIVALLYMPGVFASSSYPTPTPWSGCTADCPSNAFAVADGWGGLMDVLGPARVAAAAILYTSAGLLIARRVRRATPLARTSLTPVLAVAVARFLGATAFLVLRAGDASVEVVSVASLVLALTTPVIAAGFFVGLLRWRLRTARALERIGAGLETATGPASLQALLAASLDDPALRLYIRGSAGEWRDADGVVIASAAKVRAGRFALEVRDEAGPTALVICDEAIEPQERLLDAIRSSVRSAIEHQRLTEILAETREEVAASRARIAAAADAERRRIERDIHDGAQQRLIALGMRLQLAEEVLEDDPRSAGRMLHELREQVTEVIDEVRSLCRGIYPAALTDAGPADALRSSALHLPVAVAVRERGLRRHPPGVESAVFFCCMEAIQNAIKHGGKVRSIVVGIQEENGEVRFSVADDGGGFEPAAGNGSGAGITNMHDRLAALGGDMTISSHVDGGTTVIGWIPLADDRGAHGPNWTMPAGGSGGAGGGAGSGGGAGGTGGGAAAGGGDGEGEGAGAGTG
jgi:signal transduction histidine kinase